MHKLLAKEPGKEMLLLGNEALARGALEAGVGFASTYPGTPSSELSLNFFQISRETDLYFEYSTNEKVALEVAAAAANCGVRSMCVMKHVGVNVAADALMTLAYVGVKAGMVLLSADDPHMFSSQNEQDNRYYGKLSGLPVVEPSSVAEAKEMAVYAFEVSEALGEPVILRTTTRVNHSSAKVALGSLPEKVKTEGQFEKDPFNYVTVPAVSRKLHVRLLERLKKAADLSNTSPYNIRTGKGRYGIICNGVSYFYVTDALKALGRESDFSVLRVGFSNPMPDALVKAFLADCDRVLVAEEGEPFMEEAVKAMAAEEKRCIDIAGKREDLFSRLSEFDPQLVARCIARYFDIPYTPPTPADMSGVPEIPQRPPNLCAGCSHRATFYAVKKAAEGYDTIFPTDIGCYTLGFLPPLSMGDFLICMGSSVGTACGFSRASNQKVVAFIGDSTFFHSGIPALINGVFNNHDFTLVILDNGTTAMTGHQPHPGVDMDELNFSGFQRVSIEALVKGAGVQHVSVIRPYNLKKSIEAIREAIEFKGVSVVIAREECVLKAKSLKRGSARVFYVSDRCKNHRDCINTLACPAFYVADGRVQINPNLCAGCAVCVQVCPEKAIVPVKQDQK
ncbi:indolepyruvate ferredoxin oxidoreductase subunit alpha [Desulfosudis oleivorans]|uniref:Indolepyruvate oxidoreductase subunit IorA n=1 Tax=Desulfosudis oleivorans (strain DSM 6200 / JCM 39069 / Hxd3) TaxID=96561 RepID=A8ZTI6_DESOH|nr:indolepyruvate ferredoxin oxidoreductase subunit alpha [Desulfosudis oleivorans]ABW66250.1 thiamine pyrophosphate protein domain protein TPP-binding [Desulfosudis oleivorans Hxd3]